MVGGNINATIQMKSTQKNAIGEPVETWTDLGQVVGWLDYNLGTSDNEQYKAHVQDSTHVFICDYKALKAVTQGRLTAENGRIIVNGSTYIIKLIDNVMELNEHFEVYLQFVGGGLYV